MTNSIEKSNLWALSGENNCYIGNEDTKIRTNCMIGRRRKQISSWHNRLSFTLILICIKVEKTKFFCLLQHGRVSCNWVAFMCLIRKMNVRSCAQILKLFSFSFGNITIQLCPNYKLISIRQNWLVILYPTISRHVHFFSW